MQYSIDGCHSNTSQSSSNYSVSIPGRLAGQESVSSRVNQGQGVHSQIDYFTGSNNQSREIGSNSIPKFHIHRDEICNSRQYCQSSLGQSTRYSMPSILVSEASCCHGKNVSLITGETECVCSICGISRLHLRPLQMAPFAQWEPHVLPLEHKKFVTEQIKHHLGWWLDRDRFIQGLVLKQSPPPHTVITVASCSGWSALEPEGFMCHGVWQQNQSQLHINILEMKAILLALSEFQHILSNSSVMIVTDSSSVVAYL